MKKYLIIPILFLFAGCNNWLDLLPKNEQVTADYWKTKEDVEAVVASGYYYMREATPYLIDWGELRGASIIAQSGDAEKNKLQNFQLMPTSSLCKWAAFYQVINMANSVIVYAPQVQAIDATYSDAAAKSHQTEAYFMRALMYFYLVRNYKEVPLVIDPYVDDSAPYSIAKSTEQEIIAQIKADLLAAIQTGAAKEYFDGTWATKGRATQWALYALMADVCLWSEDYANCVVYVNRLLEADSPYRPAFMSIPEQWFTLFNPGNSNESIFELNWDYTNFGQTAKSPSTYFNLTGNYVFSEEMTNRLISDWGQTISLGLESVRSLYGAFSPMGTSSDGGETINALIWKYVGTETRDHTLVRINSDANYIIYRMADVLLMKAEAMIWQGPEHWQAAVDIINQIRRRAYVPELELNLADETEDTMLGYVLHERDIELAAEGKRWYDLVRLGKSKNYTHKALFIETIVENNATTNDSWIRSVLKNEYAWFLPIPFSELEVNEKLVQNPYYKTTN